MLVDSERIALEELAAMMAEYARPMSVAECQDAFMGMHNDDIVRAIEAMIGRPLPGEGAKMRRRMLARLEQELRPVAGAAEALARIDRPVCVASSSDHARIRLTLEWTHLARFFGEAIFSGYDVPQGKPAPDLFLHAAERMGVAPRDCIVIEDSTAGVQAGVRAGMRVIGFTGGSHTNATHAARLRAAGAVAILPRMADLPSALARLSAEDAA